MTKVRALVLLLSFALAACNQRGSGPLPGDSVTEDGGVTLSPPRLGTAPAESHESREALGPIESRLFPPELVMDHQAALAITGEQRGALIRETERGHAEMVRLQWDLQADKETLVKILDADKVDEAKVAEAASHVMSRETRVKSSHLTMLVRVKNLLTSEQQAKLRAIRADARPSASRSADAGASVVEPAPNAIPARASRDAAASGRPAPKGAGSGERM